MTAQRNSDVRSRVRSRGGFVDAQQSMTGRIAGATTPPPPGKGVALLVFMRC